MTTVGIDDAAYPSASSVLSSVEQQTSTLSDGQWSWLQLHQNAAIEKWRARQHPEHCDKADVLIVELDGMMHGLGSQVKD